VNELELAHLQLDKGQTNVIVSKNAVLTGYVKSVGTPRGQVADYRSGAYHAVEYPDYYVLHKDEVPADRPVEHFLHALRVSRKSDNSKGFRMKLTKS
jgi:hypothetical protein